MFLNSLFRKDLSREAHDMSRAWETVSRASPSFSSAHLGLVAGVKVATGNGWRGVEAVQEGDRVLTFDDGLQIVRHVERRFLAVGLDGADALVHLPADALGNREAISVLADQPVLVESDLGESMFGDPFTLVPAHALIGFGNIRAHNGLDLMEVVTLCFDTPQIVFGNVGALFYCPAHEDTGLLASTEESCAPGYGVLPPAKARRFVAFLANEDRLDHEWKALERNACPVS